jgi:hypothetical protein
MVGYLALQGLDITYTILAHVVQSDGSVIGVVTEPEVGRVVQFRDRALVYDAISRLQQRRLIYNGIHPSKIHILHGKVRLSNLASIRYFEDPVELNEEAEIRHWEPLEELFNSLDPDDEVHRLSIERIIKQFNLRLLPDFPSPERPIFVRLQWGTCKPFEWRSQCTNDRARKRGVVSLSVELVSPEVMAADTAGATDSPLIIQKTRPGRESNALVHPYHRRPKRLMLKSSSE